MVIEAMTRGLTKRRGVLVSNQLVIQGGGDYAKVLSDYHLRGLHTYHVVKPGDTVHIGKITVQAVRAQHTEPQALGFIFRGSKTIGATGDGEYYPHQEDSFGGCDCLLLNCLRPRNDPWPNHMNTSQALELIKKTKPGLAVLKDFGMKMHRGLAEKEAAWIQAATSVKTIAATDGLVLTL
jgi:phosphoribosyl 1,2-cyclic phosphodiesterase